MKRPGKFILALLACIVAVSVGSGTAGSRRNLQQVPRLSVKDTVIHTLFSRVDSYYQDASEGDLYVLSISEKGAEYKFRVTLSDSIGLEFYLTFKNFARPSGFFYFNSRLVLVFGTHISDFFKAETDSLVFTYLPIAARAPVESETLMVYEPEVFLFAYINHRLVLEEVERVGMIKEDHP